MTASVQEILIVEDSATQAVQLQLLLQRAGFVTSVATNAAEALEQLKQRPVILVLADVLLPDTNGYDLCRQIKSNPETRHLPVILLTVLSDPHDIIRGVQCGADNFIVKPYDERRLLARIRYILANRVLRENSSTEVGVEVLFGGETHFINSDRVQMLDLLMASYETAIENAADLRRAKEDAELANRAKSELLSRVGNEFRAPLNAVLGFAQLMEAEERSAQDYENLRHILDGGRHMLRVVDKMLEIARLDIGELPLEDESVDWREVVIWCGDVVRPLAASHAVEIRYDLQEGAAVRITSNRERLSEVLLHLLSNAIKYNRPGGAVDLSAHLVSEDLLQITVRDTGIGIARQKLGLLFTPFERLGIEKQGIEGSGIGLALAKRLVDAMGGNLTVESELGKGTTFTLELPTRPRRLRSPARRS